VPPQQTPMLPMPPMPPMPTGGVDQDEALNDLLMAWYYRCVLKG
jgi:hypothetical protein